MKQRLIALCAGITCGLASMVGAQDANEQNAVNLYDLTLEQLANIVVTASKVPQSLSRVTEKVDVITEQQISRIVQGKRNLAELIQYLPGASVSVLSRNDANWGSYGGIGPKYSTYMLQGLPIDAFMDPMVLDAMAIQRIEVQRGPASVMYPEFLSQDFAGSQSPLAGTVNLILKEDVATPLSTVTLDYGSYDTYAVRAYHQDRVDRCHVFGGAAYEQSDYVNYSLPDSWLNMLQDPEYTKFHVFLGASVYLDEKAKHKIALFGNETLHDGNMGRVNREYDHQYGLLNAEYSGQLTDAVKATLKAGIRSYDRSWEEDNYDNNQDLSLRENAGVEQNIVPMDASLTFRHFQDSNLTIGSDYQKASYKTWVEPANKDKVDRTVADASQVGVYAQEELQVGKATLRGGGRLNKINNDIDKLEGQAPGSSDQTWDVALWSVGAKYRLAEDWALFANGGNSFLTPGFKAVGGTLSATDRSVPGRNGQLPNPNLKPESGMGYDLGLDGRLSPSLSLSVRAFRNTISDAIIDSVVSEDPSQTMSENADGETVAQGIEMDVQQRTDWGIDWFANATLTQSEIVAPGNPDQDGAEVPFVPGVMANVGATCYLPYRIEVSLMLHWSGRIYDSSSKENRNSFDSGELVNVMASKAFAVRGGRTVTVFVKLYNATDNKIDMPWQFQDPGFQGTFGVTAQF